MRRRGAHQVGAFDQDRAVAGPLRELSGEAGDTVGVFGLGPHLSFYANGPVAWVEEIVVAGQDRGRGAGRALMSAFEQWADASGCALIALATRRAAPFYRALGYEESATYFRKVRSPPRG